MVEYFALFSISVSLKEVDDMPPVEWCNNLIIEKDASANSSQIQRSETETATLQPIGRVSCNGWRCKISWFSLEQTEIYWKHVIVECSPSSIGLSITIIISEGQSSNVCIIRAINMSWPRTEYSKSFGKCLSVKWSSDCGMCGGDWWGYLKYLHLFRTDQSICILILFRVIHESTKIIASTLLIPKIPILFSYNYCCIIIVHSSL